MQNCMVGCAWGKRRQEVDEENHENSVREKSIIYHRTLSNWVEFNLCFLFIFMHNKLFLVGKNGYLWNKPSAWTMNPFTLLPKRWISRNIILLNFNIFSKTYIHYGFFCLSHIRYNSIRNNEKNKILGAVFYWSSISKGRKMNIIIVKRKNLYKRS